MANSAGGQAFPARDYIIPAHLKALDVHELGETRGMTLRDYFAAKALQGMYANAAAWSEDNNKLAEWSYQMADAMLAHREQVTDGD